MKALTVKYERLYNLGNFDHEKIGIEIEVQDNETANEVLEKARVFCRLNSATLKRKMESAQAVVANRQNRYVSEVEEAEKTIAEVENREELPF